MFFDYARSFFNIFSKSDQFLDLKFYFSYNLRLYFLFPFFTKH